MQERKRLRIISLVIVSVLVSPLAASWVNDQEQVVPEKNGQQQAGAGKRSRLNDHERYQMEVNRYEREIRKNWDVAEISDAKAWVVYSNNWQVKRVVDYQANEIRVTLPRREKNGQLDFIETNSAVKKELVEILKTNLRSAYEDDPIGSTISDQFKDDEEYIASLTSELVLSELFETRNPSNKEVDRVAVKLMQSALIIYQQNFAFNSEFSVTVPVTLSKKLTYKVPLPKDRLRKKAKQLRPTVEQFATKLNVPQDLMFAIIHTESHFNPLARSPIPAYGLMQIVPSTAGKDASRLLFDKAKRFSPSYLYNPKNNIEVGAAYLNLLYYRYLSDISNPKSRLYCVIAAYNTGATNVAKAFVNVPQMNKAIPYINQMSDEDVLSRLLKELPSTETKAYLKKVLSRKPLYKSV